jgi:hypothetical protein
MLTDAVRPDPNTSLSSRARTHLKRRSHPRVERVTTRCRSQEVEAVQGEGLGLLGATRVQLLSELATLADKRQTLEAQQEALGKELEEVDLEVEATQRVLGLVEATEQQLVDQGQGGAGVEEVRGGLW